jgi:protein-S-isoprenylcysteine O-methyltransferase Ste14
LLVAIGGSVFRINGGSGGSNGNGAGPPEEPEKVTFHWENLGSARYWFGAAASSIGFVILVSILASLVNLTVPDSLIQVLGLGFFALALLGGLVGRRYWCPYCRGMVKAGATVCQHCGREFEI